MTFTRIDVLRRSDSFSEGVHTKETTAQGPLWAGRVEDRSNRRKGRRAA